MTSSLAYNHTQMPGIQNQELSFGFLQNYVRNLIDFENSVLGGSDNLDKIEQYLSQGHNVVVLANHQTEADPGASTSTSLYISNPNKHVLGGKCYLRAHVP